MATRLYLRDLTESGAPTAGEKSAKTATVANSGSTFESLALRRSAGTAQTTRTLNSSATTSLQRGYMARFTSAALDSNISANTWTVALAVSEGNGAANMFLTLSIYVWRPGTSSVVGYVYDGDVDLGVEWSISEDGQVITVSGSAVSGVQTGDRLVCEVWFRATQQMANAYTQTLYFDGTTPVTDTTSSDAASYIETPQDAIFAPAISSATMSDSGAQWNASSERAGQDIVVTFDQAMELGGANYNVGDTVAGLTVSVNGGAAQATTYRSGEGTATWTVRTAAVISSASTVTISYDRTAVGSNIVSTVDGGELRNETNVAVTNSLTKRVRMGLKNSAGSDIANESIKLSVHTFDSGNTANANWMARDSIGNKNPTTTATGVVDVQYTGAAAVGATIYVVVIRPNTTPTESFIWTDTVK